MPAAVYTASPGAFFTEARRVASHNTLLPLSGSAHTSYSLGLYRVLLAHFHLHGKSPTEMLSLVIQKSGLDELFIHLFFCTYGSILHTIFLVKNVNTL